MRKNKFFTVFLLLFSTLLFAELNTDEVSRDICKDKKGYEQGFYGNNKSVVCRTPLTEETESTLSGIFQKTFLGETYLFEEGYAVEVFSYEGDDLDSLVVTQELAPYQMYSKDFIPEGSQKVVTDGKLIDHENTVSLIVTAGYDLMALIDHKMTFIPATSESDGRVSASVLIDNNLSAVIELKNDDEVIGTFNMFIDQTYKLKNAEVNLTTKEHDTNHDKANIEDYVQNFIGVVSTSVNGKKSEWIGFYETTESETESITGDGILELHRVTGKDSDGDYTYEDAVSLGLEMKDDGSGDRLILYKYVDGVAVEL